MSDRRKQRSAYRQSSIEIGLQRHDGSYAIWRACQKSEHPHWIVIATAGTWADAVGLAEQERMLLGEEHLP
jgi:hypothetical protein